MTNPLAKGGHPPAQNGIHLLALDLDGTLIGDNLAISSAVSEAIAQAQRAGVAVTVATGRMHSFAVPFARDLRITTPLISYQGGLIRAADAETPLYRATMQRDLGVEILTWQAQYDWEVVLYADDDAYVARSRHPRSFFFDNVGERCIWVDDLRDVLADRELMKIIVFVEPEEGSRVESLLRERFGGQLTVIRSHALIVEAIPIGVSKADALQRLAGFLEIPRSQVMAIGDQDNDAPMLAWAGIGVAMGNASPASQAAANLIAPSLDEDGVAWAIERHILSV